MNDELKTQTILNSLVKFIILNPIAIGSSLIIFLSSCSVQKQIEKAANKDVLDAVPLQTAHVGISIYEPATNKYWYDYQGDKYFVPASNTKIPTCYAAMKYLGDSLVGLQYGFTDSMYGRLLIIEPTGDPSFLHPDFKQHPVLIFLKQQSADPKLAIGLVDSKWKDDRWGDGWSWNDYQEPYMAERSSMPVFGNVLKIRLKDVADRKIDSSLSRPVYSVFKTSSHLFDSIVNENVAVEPNVVYWKDETVFSKDLYWKIQRKPDENYFELAPADKPFTEIDIPFKTYGSNVARTIIRDSLKIDFVPYLWPYDNSDSVFIDHHTKVVIKNWHNLYSQPTDSLLKPMMHRSDNFFAEQLLLMVSNERMGIMNDEKIIDTLLKTDFKDLPQKPGWVDGSGLSRYNLFTPKDFVFILNKMKNEFGMERVKIVFPTGGEGTLADYYVADSNYIYAKTGTLSGVVAISGYLYTKKGKELIFSVLVNNHKASGTQVRRAVEKFLHGVRNKY